MDRNKTPRLLAAAKEFNIDKEVLIETLINNGFYVESNNPSARLTEKMYQTLQNKFNTRKEINQTDTNFNKTQTSLILEYKDVRDNEESEKNIFIKKSSETDHLIEYPKVTTSLKPQHSLETSSNNETNTANAEDPKKLSNYLNIHLINPEKLDKALKQLGLKLSQFENISENHIESIIEIFKIAVHLDPKSKNKYYKLDLRSKLCRLLKGDPKSITNSSISENKLETLKIESKEYNKKNDLKLLSKQDSIISDSKKKLGKIKFYDSIKGFGYVHSYDDKKDCFIHVSKLITTGIDEDDIVMFETVDSRKKPGELDAVKVVKQIPVFIFNKESASKSIAYPLLDSHLEKEITLTEKFETGFAVITARYWSTSWKVTIIESEIIQKSESIIFSKRIIVKLLPKINEYRNTIQWLTELLQSEIKETELNLLYSEAINSFEQKSIAEINKEIKDIIEVSFFKSFLEEKKRTLNKISFVLWGQNLISQLPTNNTELEGDFWSNELLPSLDRAKLRNVFEELYKEEGATIRVKDIFSHILKQQFIINSKDELENIILFLDPLISVFPSITIEEANYDCKRNQYFIELYLKGLIKELSETRTLKYIDDLKYDDEKALFIEKLPSDKILTYYSAYPSLANYKKKYIASIIENEFSKIDFLCFDLESDGEKINEFAWKTKENAKSQVDFKKQDEGIFELVSLLNSGILIIGQNIKEFDLPILANHGATPSTNLIWDTLEIEMMLNPQRFSYGLKAKHSAASDTELTYQLFKNQLSRIIVSQSNITTLKDLLPLKAIEAINLINTNPNWALLDYQYFETQSNEFYRPNPTNQNISEHTFIHLKKKITEDGNIVIIAPEFLWNTLSHQFDFTFYCDSKTFSLYLSKDKIELFLDEDKLLKAILLRYVDVCKSKGLKPYLQHLPIAIRLKLTTEKGTLICDNSYVDFENFNNKPICIKPTDVEILKKHRKDNSNLKVVVVGNELNNLTSKLQLGQDLDFATIFNQLKNEPIWLQMSGGKSFIGLEQKQCRQLGIDEFPEFVQNIWLEKIGKGKFKVWCNLNFEACINNLPLKEVFYIEWIDETIAKTNSYIIRPDAKKSGYLAEQKRVNPESLYRKLYWTYQFKLFEGIGNKNNPKVLIVNDELESEILSAFARRKGYFIPDTMASLARQVEILHTHKSPKKLLFATFQSLDKVISSNYTGALDFIWDSFMLHEKLQMLEGEISADTLSSKEQQQEDDHQNGSISVQKDFDSFSLIKLHKPLIDYYYKMLYDNNQDSQLFLCDTRLTDYFGIENSLNVNTQSVPMWFKEADYVADKEIAGVFFSSAHENALTDFNIDEAKEILRQIFLQPEEGGTAYQWHDYQHPCLNEILPAKKNLLISLPTGAGKSLLFQGPALFRSAFSCKLSIVISPLRALMQDQVDSLWNKGFYSNVEFLSGDKSHVEVRDIYRRIAGGEVTLLYITPERFRSRSFENCLLTRLDADSGLEYVVFDEAHCISQWGQEFRPDYLNAGRKVAGYSGVYQMRKLLFSATISEQVFEEISLLMPGVVTVEGTEKSYNPVRDHIKMDFKHNVVEDDRLIEIANYLKSGKFNPEISRAIIFVKSRKKVEECTLIMSDTLKQVFDTSCNFLDKIGGFHAGMDAEDRKDTYEKYKSGDIVILFATKAFGMGMDIPNIHFVTHYSPPSTFEDFLQEVGRAGRNEKNRLEAGFDTNENPIKTLCLTTNSDFAKLKDQLHESRISWHEVKDIKLVLEEYIAKFKPLITDSEIPVAVPFNLYSNEKGSVNDGLDSKFRIALHWLERLERIRLGYFTITHLEFDTASLSKLSERINKCPDKNCEKVCHAIIELLPQSDSSNEVIQLSIASLRGVSRLSLENLFTALLKVHSAGILKLLQDLVIEPTKIRLNETNHCKNIYYENEKYPALQVVFSLAVKILDSVPSNGSKFFEGDELDDFLRESINENINFKQLPWTKKEQVEFQTNEYNNYIKDIIKKRSKHAFTIIRLLGKTKHETKMEKVKVGSRKIKIKQSLFNGYHKKDEWLKKIRQLQKDCIKLLDYVAKNYFDNNVKNFNWPDIISDLNFKGNVQYISDLMFILSVLGYCKTGGLLPAGIEVYHTSTEKVDETNLQSHDKKIFDEFEETRKVRELKLIALEVLAGFQKGSSGNEAIAVRKKQDTFIRNYFACNSLASLLKLLQDELPPNDPLLVKWRGDAIKTEEDRLNDEQRKVYDAEISQHISVMAGPGSGKTHTLTLRVAKLVHHIGTNPEEILVLAYNRAVVSELKERLGRLFNDLGYGNLAKRIKIFTFHGLAKRYCLNEVNGQPFDEWENILLNQLNISPGHIMNNLSPLKHILVDEFQDINNVRINLLNKLHQLTDSYLFIIGDPNQSIYGYERIKEGGSMSPWPYYAIFNKIFTPKPFELYDNHRSYPAILNLASQILSLPTEHQQLIPKPTRIPDNNFISNYAEIIDRTQQKVDWWDQISILMKERIGNRPYKQIAILFRTNNEVYRGFQKVKGLVLPNIRIRIQGSLPYEFTRVRECFEVINWIKKGGDRLIIRDFKTKLKNKIESIISENPNWNAYYLKTILAITLDFLEENDGVKTYNDLIDYISELTHRDDGQLYKIYEKHLDKISTTTHETEIVLTTMHKVKGLEFDSVIIPPSFSNLPLKIDDDVTQEILIEQLDEEKRLAFVSYTRARYRLIIFKHNREIALSNNKNYVIPEGENVGMGIPVHPEIKKLNIGWAAGNYIFNSGVNDFIKNQIKSGDFVHVRRRTVQNNGKTFTVHELFKDGSERVIGLLSRDSGNILQHSTCKGFVVNEVVVWSYEDTVRFDHENPGKNYSSNWCEGAKSQGFIYLVDFAGFGIPED